MTTTKTFDPKVPLSRFVEDYTHVPLSNRGRIMSIAEVFRWIEWCPYLELKRLGHIEDDHTLYSVENLQAESSRYEEAIEIKRYVYAPKLLVRDPQRNIAFMTVDKGQYMTVGGILTQIFDLLDFDVFRNFGFIHADTGGGCTAYHGYINKSDPYDGNYMFITHYDDELRAPCSPMDPICVGLYHLKHGYMESHFCSNLWDLALALTDESFL